VLLVVFAAVARRSHHHQTNVVLPTQPEQTHAAPSNSSTGPYPGLLAVSAFGMLDHVITPRREFRVVVLSLLRSFVVQLCFVALSRNRLCGGSRLVPHSLAEQHRTPRRALNLIREMALDSPPEDLPYSNSVSGVYLPLVLLVELGLQPALVTMDVRTEDLLAQTSVNHRL